MSKKQNRSNKKKPKKPFFSAKVPTGAYDVVIVGGGASGLACAVSYAQAICNQSFGKMSKPELLNHKELNHEPWGHESSNYESMNDELLNCEPMHREPFNRESSNRKSSFSESVSCDANLKAQSVFDGNAGDSDTAGSDTAGIDTGNNETGNLVYTQKTARPRMVILEAGKRIGTSIMRSGNGRCNFSNSSLDVTRYHHASFVEKVFSALDENRSIPSVLSWFEQLGLVWEEAPGTEGLLYPFSKKANSVLDVLRKALDAYGVEICEMSEVLAISPCDHSVSSLSMDRDETSEQHEAVCSSQETGGFVVRGKTCKGENEYQSFEIAARKVVLASGGATSQNILPNRQISYCNPKPILGPVQAKSLSHADLSALDGIRVQSNVKLYRSLSDAKAKERAIFEEEGEVLFRSYGLSGIVIFNASRYAEPGDILLLDLMPHFTAEVLREMFLKRLEQQRDAVARFFFVGFVVDPLAEALLQAAGIEGEKELLSSDIDHLVAVCKTFPFEMQGIADERTCQVRRGGVQPEEVDFSTLEVSSCPGLFVLGEALDVDGPCGGYNLHWAWTTGLLAGSALANPT